MLGANTTLLAEPRDVDPLAVAATIGLTLVDDLDHPRDFEGLALLAEGHAQQAADRRRCVHHQEELVAALAQASGLGHGGFAEIDA